jgi:hypothetical protein
MKYGLFPETALARSVRAMDTGQLNPKHTSINASKILIYRPVYLKNQRITTIMPVVALVTVKPPP